KSSRVSQRHLGATPAGSVTSDSPRPYGVLHLVSTPTGAVVMEDGNVLGATPIDVRIERTSLPRTFQLKREGFGLTVVTPGPTEGAVPLAAALAPAARGAKPAPRVAKPPPAVGSGESELRPSR